MDDFDSSDSEIESEGEDEVMVETPVGPNIRDFYDVGKNIGKYVKFPCSLFII